MNHHFNISSKTFEHATAIEETLQSKFSAIDKIKTLNFYKVLAAMQSENLSDRHFSWMTGYGYNDEGREKVESIYSIIFKAEDAIVRPQLVNGTHALTLGLTAILRPNDTMLAITGTPYDTLKETIGLSGPNGSSLMEIGVNYEEIELSETGAIQIDTVLSRINEKTKMVYIQRSSGYAFRRSLTISDIEEAITAIKQKWPKMIVMVDNCYGEFIEEREPIEVGADLCAGSLIKNPGGGLALTGGYLVGRQDIIDLCAHKLTAPGIGKECGLTFGQTRTILQGLFLAPEVVAGAIKGAIFTAKLFEDAGYDVKPKWNESRSDIIQAVKLGSEEKVIAFCRAIQNAAPVDSHVTPYPWDMPGYDTKVIMAAGAFVQGSSIELSADAPMREPYAVFFQGGLTYDHSKLGSMLAYEAITK
ncbi:MULTISPECIES: methionine gamma-lyase family protein [unclassified Fusibacter]|uniref:methionine gamma-lyase family protein n=1 Tax=unclassified Fusibacter TaxID=2624464 RepID=UPI001FAAA8AB|nr:MULTISPECIES: methionine gamma-lyase family protein [unclassified Fusibacter]MCK8058835.1 methionine gamma-lyase family protein [Fusibacter sp. A2]